MIEIYTLEQSKQWDTIVCSFHDYDVYWLSGYVKAFKIHGDGEPFLFFYDDGETRGINVVMKRDVADDIHFAGLISRDTYYDFSSPYGYGGWIIEGENTVALFREYFDWCKGNGIVSEFIRFHPLIKNHTYVKEKYEVTPLGNTISVDTRDCDVIWTNFTSKNRNVIRKAINAGIEIKHGMSERLFETFKSIYDATMDKNDADTYYYFHESFYDSILNDLKDNATIFYAELDGQIVAASIVIFANGKLNYHLSGSMKKYQHLAPTNLLLYEVAKWGCENNMQSFHLGGGVGSGEDSLFKFKKAFYKFDDLPRFFIGKKVFDAERYNELQKYRTNITNIEFFPAYRG